LQLYGIHWRILEWEKNHASKLAYLEK